MEPIILEAGGIDKAVLLRELVNLAWREEAARRPLPLRDAQAEIALRLGKGNGPEGKGPLYFEYLDGMRIGADLAGDHIDLSRYREVNFPQLPGEELKRQLLDRIGQYAFRDAESGLIAREWVRTSRRRGTVTETPLEGKEVAAAFIDPNSGELVRVAGTVARNDDDGQLVVRSWTDHTGRTETRVPRDASVTVRQAATRHDASR